MDCSVVDCSAVDCCVVEAQRRSNKIQLAFFHCCCCCCCKCIGNSGRRNTRLESTYREFLEILLRFVYYYYYYYYTNWELLFLCRCSNVFIQRRQQHNNIFCSHLCTDDAFEQRPLVNEQLYTER